MKENNNNEEKKNADKLNLNKKQLESERSNLDKNDSEPNVRRKSEEDKKRHARDVASKFREFLTNANYVVQLMAEDEEFKFEMERIISRLNRLPLQK